MLTYRGLYATVTPWERQYPIKDLASPFIGAANVGFLVREGPPLPGKALEGTGWQQLAIPSERPLTVYRNRDVLPRYRLIGDVRSAADMAQARKLLAAIDPRRTAVVECSGVPSLRNAEIAGSVAVSRYTPEKVTMRVEAAQPSLLLASEGYHFGWYATIDRREQAVCPRMSRLWVSRCRLESIS